MQKKRKKQKGITITETLVAAVLISLAMMCISPMFAWSVKLANLSKERSAATQAAQRVVEQVHNSGFTTASAIVNRTTTQAVLSDDLQGEKLYIRDVDGQISTTDKDGFKLLQVQRIYSFVENSPQSLADDLIQVTVKVNWPGSNGNSVTMGIALPRNGLG